MHPMATHPNPLVARRPLHWAFLGSVPYLEAVTMQEAAREAIKRGAGPERLFLLEHPHVYTLGRNATAVDVLLDRATLARRGITVAECDRGGQVTYHGPGQLVGYPVINLSPDRRDIRRYVQDLQRVLIATLAELGVDAAVRPGPEHIGLWVGEAKIASIGVHLSRWISTHGFALNVTTDLTLFRGIVACGLDGVEMTSVERLTGRRPPLPEVAGLFARLFAAHFDRDLVADGALPAIPATAADSVPASTADAVPAGRGAP